MTSFYNITNDNNDYNNPIILNNKYDSSNLPKYTWFNNPKSGLFNISSNTIGLSINGTPELLLTNNNLFTYNIYCTNIQGSALNLSNINWSNIINKPDLITSNVLTYLVSNLNFDTIEQRSIAINDLNNNITNLSNVIINYNYIDSNTIFIQKYINSNSIQDLLSFYISSNNLLDQNYINSNSIDDNLSFYISSNILSKQNLINSNSIEDIISFYISSNLLNKQNYINSNSIINITSFLISSNLLNKQNYINSNSIIDITSFLISSNNLLDQNYINSNSIQDLLSFLISSNNLIDQNYINSNSIIDITSFLISSNNLIEQKYINSNSIEDITSFYISSNNLIDQNYINSNSIIDINSFYISSNNLIDQNYINSNSIIDINIFYISSNILNKQNYINSNSISTLLSFFISSNDLINQNLANNNTIINNYISSNNLTIQNYINSNSVNDIISFLITSNNLFDQNYVNSNSIEDIILFYINSNDLAIQKYISSNSVRNILKFFISSNNLADQYYINSNSIQDNLSFYISSNNLIDQNYINSNSIQDITSFLISSNNLSDQQLINSNSFQDIINFYISSNNLFDQQYINSNSINDVLYFYLNSNNIIDILDFYISSNVFEINLFDYINSNIFNNIIKFYISSNNLFDQNYINSNSIIDITSFLISSNNLFDQQYINSNSFKNITSFLISSNLLNKQNYINSNSFIDNLSFYISSNILLIQNYINSNSITDNLSFYISSNILNKQNYINSNSFEDITSFLVSSNILNKQNYINSNSIEDLLSFYISSNIFEVNLVNSNAIIEITSFYISSNVLQTQNYINSNSIHDITSFLISSNNLCDQKYINSNSVEDLLSFYISSNIFEVNLVNSNAIIEITSFYISSNVLQTQNYINSNSVEDLLSFYISSNIFEVNLVNSNAIIEITSFYISSNILQIQNYINSNSVEDLLSFYISSNNLYDQQYINSNTLSDNLNFYVSSNNLNYFILNNNLTNNNSLNNILSSYFNYKNQNSDSIIEGQTNKFIINGAYNSNLYIRGDITASNLFIIGTTTTLNTTQYATQQLQIINDNTSTAAIIQQIGYYNPVAEFYNQNNLALIIDSNGNIGINGVSSPTYNLEVNGTFYATNITGSGCNITNIKWDNLIGAPTDLLTSNVLQQQNYINSNSIHDINRFFISSNNLSDQKYINSNTLNTYQFIKDYTITTERQYPSKAYISLSDETTTTFIGKSSVYYQNFTLNTTGITYGSGTYYIYSSSTFGSLLKNALFNYDINTEGGGCQFQASQYNSTTGDYIATNYLKSGYLGDWIILKLPVAISLSKFTFIARSTWISRCPAIWRVYGANDPITENDFNEITDGHQNIKLSATDYASRSFTKTLTKLQKTYNHIGFCFNSLVGGSSSHVINFIELQLWGKEYTTQQYIYYPNTVLLGSGGGSFLQTTNELTVNGDVGISGIINSPYLTSTYITSNSTTDINRFFISSNILSKQNYINSNSISDINSFYISSNNLSDQQYINSNSISDINIFYISSNNLSDQKYINSNSIADILNFYISSNALEQNLINSNSIINITSFYVSSNILQSQNYINSNSITNINNFLISSNILNKQNYINSNSIQDLLSFYVSSNNLSDQKYINSNSIENLLNFYISSNVFEINLVNSNSIIDITSFYISSNILKSQNIINSNSIQNLLDFYISSNNLSDQNYINSNSIIDNLSFYISSNNLLDQNYINSNSIEEIILFYVSSNNLSDIIYNSGFINSNNITELNNSLGYDTIQARDNAINSIIFNAPLKKNNNNITLNYDSSKLLIDDNNQLTLSPNIEIIDNIKTFKFELKQGHITYPDLWYYQINIADYSKTFLIDQYEYNIFNLTSWSDTDLNTIYNSLVIITNQDNGIKRINTNVIVGESIDLGDGLETTEGWQLDNDINYLTWFSSTYKIIYNILADNINSNSNVTKITNNNNYSFTPSDPNIANEINNAMTYVFNNVSTYVNNNFVGSNNINIINSNLGFDTIIQRNVAINNLNNYLLNITSNTISSQYYINSNTIYNNYISSNQLKTQQFINSNSISLNYISSNQLYSQQFINSNSIAYNYISSNQLYSQQFINSNTIELNYISSNQLYSQNFINSNTISLNYITSNQLYSQNFINSNTISLNYITSNQLYSQNFINSNNIANINSNLGFDTIIERNNAILSLSNVFVTNTLIPFATSNDVNTIIGQSLKIVNNNYTSNIIILPPNYCILYNINNYNNIIKSIIWYKFDNNGITIDANGNYNLSFSTSTVAYSGVNLFGNNSIYIFNTGTTYLYSLSYYNLNNKSFSISFWTYMKANYIQTFVSYGNTDSDHIIFWYHDNNFYLDFNGYILSTNTDYSSYVNSWIFLSFTYNINTNVRNIYLNNINIANDIFPSYLNCTTIFSIGTYYKSPSNYVCNSYFDDFRIHNFELTPANINSLYSGYSQILLLYYNIGINNPNPFNSLDVVGNIRSTEFIGSATNLSNINWYNISNIPTNIINVSTNITSNVLANQYFISSNTIYNNYISCNQLYSQKFINSNTIALNYITSNQLYSQLFINSNSILYNYISSNQLYSQQFINSNFIYNNYISCNQLYSQLFINSNSILLNYISSNQLYSQQFINSNSISYIYISSNQLKSQQYINSNTIALNYITSNQLYSQQFINSNSISYNYISSNQLYSQLFINSNSISYNYISSNQLYSQLFINSNSISYNYISSNQLKSQLFINSNTIALNYITSNQLYSQQFINSNSISYNYISSNQLGIQGFITSNFYNSIILPNLSGNVGNFISSNVLLAQYYVNSNSIYNILLNQGTLSSFINQYNTTVIPSKINATTYTYTFINNGTIQFLQGISCDILIVGAGGNGGIGNYSGGGGGGEVIIASNYYIDSGNYNITVDSNYSSISLNATTLMKANKGGSGGYYSGFSFIRQYPPKTYNSIGTEVNQGTYYTNIITLNTTGITYGSGNYNCGYSSYSSTNTGIYAFDIINSTYWRSANTKYNITTGNYTGASYLINTFLGEFLYIGLVSGLTIHLSKFTIKTTNIYGSPAIFKIYGSNDGITWYEITNCNLISSDYTIIDSYYTYNKSLSYSLNNIYKYFGIVINQIISNNSCSYCEIEEFQLYGFEYSSFVFPTIGGSGGGGSGGTGYPCNPITNMTINSVFGSTSDYYFIAYNGSTNTFSFPYDTTVSIFMIGGGGGGGYNHGGGGGAGAYYNSTYTFSANVIYNIVVGGGGTGGNGGAGATNGGDTYITVYNNSTKILWVYGGGGAGGMSGNYNGISGGCGGGGTGWDANKGTNTHYIGGSATNTGTNGIGYNGGTGYTYFNGKILTGGGGGGAGSVGGDYRYVSSTYYSGNGGSAINITLTGTNLIVGGGGGASGWYNTSPANMAGTGGSYLGIKVGGSGINYIGAANGEDAVANTGSGGGGGSNGGGNGGSGSAGIVIIKFSQTQQLGALAGNPWNLNNTSGLTYAGNNGTSLQGGNGGGSGFQSSISGTLKTYAVGGTSASLSSTPLTKTNNTGYGGDGNGGLGASGIIILKITFPDTSFVTSNAVLGIINNTVVTTSGGGSSGSSYWNYNTYTNNNYYINNQTNIILNNNSLYYNDNIANIVNNLSGSYNISYTNGTSTLSINTVYQNIYDNNNNIINPIIWYKFENGILIDDSGNNNTLTTIGTGCTLNTSLYSIGSGCAYFNGTANYFRTPSLNKNVPLTFSFWFRILSANVNTYSTICSYGDVANNSPSINFDYTGNTNNFKIKVFIALNTLWTTTLDGLNSIISDTWYHLSLTLTNATTVIASLYINGILQSTGSGTANFTLKNYVALNIGYSGDNLRGFYGYIDDVRLYNSILTLTQINKLYNLLYINYDTSYPNIYDTNVNSNIIPSVWYKFDSNIGMLIDNGITSSYTLINNNSVSLSSSKFIKGTNSAYFISSSSQYFSCSKTLNLNAISFSISVWAYPLTNGTWLFGNGSVASTRTALSIGYNSDNTWYFGFSGDDLASSVYTDSNTWVHLAFIYNVIDNSRYIYRNGILIGTNKSLGVLNTNNVFNIGKTPYGSYYWNGYLDDFRIYQNTVLTQAQILEIYTGRITIINNISTINYNSGSVGIGSTGNSKLTVYGSVNFHGGNPFAVQNNFMALGSLTIGSIYQNYGGSTIGWMSGNLTGTAGLLLECNNNTEIAVHNYNCRVASLLYYQGGTSPIIFIGRSLYNDTANIVPVTISGNLIVNNTINSIGNITSSGSLSITGNITTNAAFISNSGICTCKSLYITNPTDSRVTYLPYTNGQHYIRGSINIDGGSDIVYIAYMLGLCNNTPIAPLHIGNLDSNGSDGYLVLSRNNIISKRNCKIGYDANLNFVIGDYGITNTTGNTWTPQFLIHYAAPLNSFVITSSGYVGIGVTNPANLLEVNGSILSSGNITAYGTLGTSSDIKLKTNIRTLDKSLNIINKINPVNFTWKNNLDVALDNHNKEDVGFIAQEIEEIIPFAVSSYKSLTTDNIYKSIKHDKIIPYLIKAVQELSEEIEKLKKIKNV